MYMDFSLKRAIPIRGHDQCDQMINLKVGKNLPKLLEK